MNPIRLFSIALMGLFVLTFSLSASAAPEAEALSDGAIGEPAEHNVAAHDGKAKRRKARHKRRNKRNRMKFPVQGKVFQAKLAKRIQRMRKRIARRLKRKNVSPEKAKRILARFSNHAATLRAAVSTAAADGKVTRKEAKRVRQIARKMKKSLKPKGGKRAKRSKRRGRKRNRKG